MALSMKSNKLKLKSKKENPPLGAIGDCRRATKSTNLAASSVDGDCVIIEDTVVANTVDRKSEAVEVSCQSDLLHLRSLLFHHWPIWNLETVSKLPDLPQTTQPQDAITGEATLPKEDCELSLLPQPCKSCYLRNVSDKIPYPNQLEMDSHIAQCLSLAGDDAVW